VLSKKIGLQNVVKLSTGIPGWKEKEDRQPGGDFLQSCWIKEKKSFDLMLVDGQITVERRYKMNVSGQVYMNLQEHWNH
jgi:hypothetical protein